MSRGSFFHARVLEPDEVSRSFAFYPSRAEAKEPVMVPAIGTRGKTKGQPLKSKLVPKLDEFGNPVMAPQDDTAEGRYKSMLTRSDYAKAEERKFLRDVAGLTVVYPEDQQPVDLMVRAVRQHPEAAALLGPGGKPEVTGHFTCEETGEPMRFRFDWLRFQERTWVELKSVSATPDNRLDTTDPAAVMRWARDGWARKSGIGHDGCRAITGDNWSGRWIVVESPSPELMAVLRARDELPRVSVVRDEVELVGVPSLYHLGTKGYGSIKPYTHLIRMAQAMREEGDYRPDCVREVVERFPLPDYVLSGLEIEGPVRLKGARKVQEATYG